MGKVKSSLLLYINFFFFHNIILIHIQIENNKNMKGFGNQNKSKEILIKNQQIKGANNFSSF